MSEKSALKTRLAAEMAQVVFPDDEVPSSAWDRLDKMVDDHFADCTTGRLRTLVDDLGDLRDCDASILEGPSGPTGPSNPSLGEDWENLRGSIRECIEELNPRDEDEAEEASGARTLERVIHGR